MRKSVISSVIDTTECCFSATCNVIKALWERAYSVERLHSLTCDDHKQDVGMLSASNKSIFSEGYGEMALGKGQFGKVPEATKSYLVGDR